jgi:hypothetical protein
MVEEVPVSFTWAGGFAASQKKKNIVAMHEAASSKGLSPVLEVSTKSEDKLGQRLSAFNLKISTPVGEISIECAFQGSKVFERGGPYTDLYKTDSRSAKRDERLKNSGRLIAFDFFGDVWPLEPKTSFYDWLYLTALQPHKSYLTRLFEYKGFSDIEFNPEKSINCQARTCALLVSLLKRDMLDSVLRSKETFLSAVRLTPGIKGESSEPFQPGLLDKQPEIVSLPDSVEDDLIRPEDVLPNEAIESSFEEAGFVSSQAQYLIPDIKNSHKLNFELAYKTNHLLQSMLSSYANSDSHSTSLSRENIYTTALMRSATIFQGLLLLIERGMVNEGRIFIRSLIENAFFVAALEQSHDDIVNYLHETDKFSKHQMAKMLLAQGAISPNHPHYKKIKKIAETKTKSPPTIKSISKLGPLEQKYLMYSQLSSEAMHFSAASLSKYMDVDASSAAWLGYKVGPGEDEQITEVIKEGTSAVLDIAIVGTTIFSDSHNNQKLKHLINKHYPNLQL